MLYHKLIQPGTPLKIFEHLFWYTYEEFLKGKQTFPNTTGLSENTKIQILTDNVKRFSHLLCQLKLPTAMQIFNKKSCDSNACGRWLEYLWIMAHDFIFLIYKLSNQLCKLQKLNIKSALLMQIECQKLLSSFWILFLWFIYIIPENHGNLVYSFISIFTINIYFNIANNIHLHFQMQKYIQIKAATGS